MATVDPKVGISMSEIKSKLLKPALTSHYICDFQPPISGFLDQHLQINSQDSKQRFDKLSLACVEASLPGSSLMTNEINDDHTGVTERQAYRRQYDDRADFTFYVGNEDYYVIRLFESWIAYAVNEQYGDQPGANNYHYRVNFPDDYCTGGQNGGSLSITKFERDYAKTGRLLTYNFVRAFPTSINSMPVSYDSSELLKFTVSFSYNRYWIESKQINPQSLPENQEVVGTIPEGAVYNDFLNANRTKSGSPVGNPALDQFGVQLPQGTKTELGITGAVIGA
jgi:hypothetical protein